MRQIAGETILVPIRGNLADLQNLFILEGTGRFIWDNLDGKNSVDRICDAVVASFDVGVERAKADVAEFLLNLKDAGIVELEN